MTIETEELDAAVTAGIITQSKADELRAFVAERRRSEPQRSVREDERFRFMTGFNDFFFAIGILLLGFGILFFTGGDPLFCLVAAATVWGLSELLVGRFRLVLPGILLSLFFILFVYLVVPAHLLLPQGPTIPRTQAASGTFIAFMALKGPPLAVAIKAMISAVAAGLYYWRFRLPFALLPVAGSLVVATMAMIFHIAGSPSQTTQAILALVCGLAVFAAAMAFDLSDRDRMTRRADNAFWLHLFAAPLIVHSLITLITPDGARQITGGVALSILLIVMLLSIVAIVIDRRALLVSALLYFGIVIAYAIGGPSVWMAPSPPSRGVIFFATLVILGTFVITLGTLWLPLRRRLIALISPHITGRLPPIQTRS